MSAQIGRLKTLLGIGGLFTFYGMVSIATLFVPYPRIGYTERTIIIIAFILITLPFVLLFGFVMSRRKKKKEAAAAETAAAGTEPANA